jgi:hypothetical protein
VGTNLEALGEILGDGENVLRGLNPAHCEAGLPTEGCFILKRHDRIEDGPSFGILKAPESEQANAPVGARQGISSATFATLLPSLTYGISRLNVREALDPFRNGGAFLQRNDDDWGEHRTAHSMLTGYQQLSNKDRKDFQRHLARMAARAVLKAPTL